MHKLVQLVAKSDLYKPSDFDIEKCNGVQIVKFLDYIDLITQAERKGEITILFRGTKRQILKSKLVSRLNSNNSLYDGLFLVGDKAKNYLKKENEIRNPVKIINSIGRGVADWVFDQYEMIGSENIGTNYFTIESNKNLFVDEIEVNVDFIDYYLMGLHRWNSDVLVNFVSATSSFDISASNNNDLVILFWFTDSYSKNLLFESNLVLREKELLKKRLPVIKLRMEEENEYSFKGFILPHYMLGVYLITENKIVLNPSLLENERTDWIQNGFEVNNEKFSDFVKTTKYKRFLNLYENEIFEENNLYQF